MVGSGWSEDSAKRFFEPAARPRRGADRRDENAAARENVAASPLFQGSDFSEWGPTDGRPFSLIGVPIKDGDAVVGTLTVDRVYDDRSVTLFDHDVRFLTMIANLVGQTLRLHKLIARDRERLMQEKAWLEKGDRLPQIETKNSGINGIVGSSPALRAVIDKIRVVAKAKSTVLLRGEFGHRQGIVRRGDTQSLAAPLEALRQAELRGAPRERARIGTLRP